MQPFVLREVLIVVVILEKREVFHPHMSSQHWILMLYIMQTGKYHQNHITTKKYFHNITFSSLMIIYRRPVCNRTGSENEFLLPPLDRDVSHWWKWPMTHKSNIGHMTLHASLQLHTPSLPPQQWRSMKAFFFCICVGSIFFSLPCLGMYFIKWK